jgi:hypothetical protein
MCVPGCHLLRLIEESDTEVYVDVGERDCDYDYWGED